MGEKVQKAGGEGNGRGSAPCVGGLVSRGAFSFARAAMIDQNRQFGPAPANRLSCALRRPSSSSLIPKGRHSHSLRGVKPTRQPPQPEATGAGWRRRNV